MHMNGNGPKRKMCVMTFAEFGIGVIYCLLLVILIIHVDTCMFMMLASRANIDKDVCEIMN